MPPEKYSPRPEPAYNPHADATIASGNAFSNYKLFMPGVSDKIEFLKPAYSSEKPTTTVVRPFPSRSYSDPNNSFEPYRKDPGGKNYFGFWLHKFYLCYGIGKPSTTWIAHDPSWGPYDARQNPLSILCSAVKFAVKKGQKKATDWEQSLHRPPFDPSPNALLEWNGFFEGGNNKGAALSYPREFYMMQGIVPYYLDKVTYQQKEGMPGWGTNKTCVIGLTASVGKSLVDLLNQEVENFRGDPADFERRYVYGDPVSLDSGAYFYIYPKGCDPRQTRNINLPVSGGDPFAVAVRPQMPGGQKKENKEIGFDCHIERTFTAAGQSLPASMTKHKQQVLEKLFFWEDILEFPSYKQQVAYMASILPAEMLVYAFYGEHNDWLTPDILASAKAARMSSLPSSPPTFNPQPSPFPAGNTGSPYDAPGGWSSTPPPAEMTPQAPMFGDPNSPPWGEPEAGSPHGGNPAPSSSPFGGAAATDSALPPPAASPFDSPVPATPAGDINSILGGFASQAAAEFGGEVPVPPPPAGMPTPPPPAAPSSGFDTPPAAPAGTAGTVAALAAARRRSMS